MRSRVQSEKLDDTNTTFIIRSVRVYKYLQLVDFNVICFYCKSLKALIFSYYFYLPTSILEWQNQHAWFSIYISFFEENETHTHNQICIFFLKFGIKKCNEQYAIHEFSFLLILTLQI